MSDSSPDISELIAEISQIQFAYAVLIAGTALVFYEYALTISTEISEIWNSKFNGAQVLFLMTRYSFMVYMALICVINVTINPSETVCRVIYDSAAAWSIVPSIGIYAIFVLRTYAVYQKNKWILAILGLPCAVNVAIGIYIAVLARPAIGTVPGVGNLCGEVEQTITPPFRLASTILALLIDVLVFTLTFAKTIRHTIEMRNVGLGNGLGYFILRDGALYFLAKLVIGVWSTTIYFIPASGSIGNWIGILVSLSNPLTIILVNRLVLNLRQVSRVQEGNAPTLDAIGTIKEPAFATNPVLGNLGAPLRMGPGDDDEFEDMEMECAAKEDGTVDYNEITEVSRDPSDV